MALPAHENQVKLLAATHQSGRQFILVTGSWGSLLIWTSASAESFAPGTDETKALEIKSAS